MIYITFIICRKLGKINGMNCPARIRKQVNAILGQERTFAAGQGGVGVQFHTRGVDLRQQTNRL